MHKRNCGAEPDVFRQAPLSPKEIIALDGLKDRPYEADSEGKTFEGVAQDICEPEPSLQTWEVSLL